MICYDVDAALSKVPVNAVPLTDDTDFKSLETAVAYNASGMALYWHFVTPSGAYTATAVTPTTSGTYDWAHQQQGMYTIEIPASGGASINNDTEGFGWFTGFATGVLPWRSPTFCFRHSALNDSLIESNTTGLLAPTTAGRTLDVSAGGEAGVDWANVGSPTTTVNLSGTTVKTATDVETDTQDIQSRLPAALVSGRIDASVGAMAANVITASAIASDAITDAKVAADVTIASVTGAVGSVTGNVGGNVAGSVGSVTGAVGSVTGNVGGNVAGSVASVTAGVTVTTNNDKTGYALSATGSAALTEGYAALGAAATLPQLLYEVRALLAEKSISSTTLTTKKLDGSTTAATYTLDDATTPSAITRAT